MQFKPPRTSTQQPDTPCSPGGCTVGEGSVLSNLPEPVHIGSLCSAMELFEEWFAEVEPPRPSTQPPDTPCSPWWRCRWGRLNVVEHSRSRQQLPYRALLHEFGRFDHTEPSLNLLEQLNCRTNKAFMHESERLDYTEPSPTAPQPGEYGGRGWGPQRGLSPEGGRGNTPDYSRRT